MRLLGAPERCELRQRVGELALGRAECRLQVEIRRRDRNGECPPGDLHFGRCGRALLEESPPITLDRLDLGDEPRLAHLGGCRRGPRCIVVVPPLPLERRARAKLSSQRRRRRLRCRERRHRPVDFLARPVAIGLDDGQPRSGRMPADVHRREQGGGQLLGRRVARRLLLGLRGQPPGLRTQLGEDVLDPGEVRLGLGQLLLGTTAPPLVAPDPGHLLEQRTPFLGTQRERLVDHPLPDEQERVVGEMGSVEQVDEVAQPDPALVEEVVVLAGAIQPPTELEDREVDGQQAIAVVEDERDVGHALGRPLLRTRPR